MHGVFSSLIGILGDMLPASHIAELPVDGMPGNSPVPRLCGRVEGEKLFENQLTLWKNTLSKRS